MDDSGPGESPESDISRDEFGFKSRTCSPGCGNLFQCSWSDLRLRTLIDILALEFADDVQSIFIDSSGVTWYEIILPKLWRFSGH